MAEKTPDGEILRRLLEREGTDLESFNEEMRLYMEGSESDASLVLLGVDAVTAPTDQVLVDPTRPRPISNPATEQLARITVRLELEPATGDVWNVGEIAGLRGHVTNTTGAPLKDVRIRSFLAPSGLATYFNPRGPQWTGNGRLIGELPILGTWSGWVSMLDAQSAGTLTIIAVVSGEVVPFASVAPTYLTYAITRK
jgi:hypothetical protein